MIDRRTSDNIKVLGLVMTGAIVMYHCGALESSPICTNPFDIWMNAHIASLFSHFGAIAMSYFFATTGFLMFSGLTFSSIPDKLLRRVKTLFVPYLVWQVLATLFMMSRGKNYSIGGWFRKVFLFGAWPPDGALWYVYAIFALACISPLFFLILKNRRIGFISLLIAFPLCFILCNTDNSLANEIVSHGYLGNLLGYFPAYYLGCFVGLHCADDKRRSAAACVAIMMACLLIFDSGDSARFAATRSLPILMIIALRLPVICGDSVVYKVTFLVYALHQPLLKCFDGAKEAMITIIPSLSIVNVGFRVGYCLFIFLLAVSVYWLLRRWPRVISLLTGGRAERSFANASREK